MVLEIADIAVQPGTADKFAAAVREGIQFAAASPGFRSARLKHGIESPDRFVLMIEWDSVEAHNKGFRESENFTRWRALIGPYLAGNPYMEHFEDVELP